MKTACHHWPYVLIDRHVIVRVGEVGIGWKKEGHLSGRRIRRRSYDERNVILTSLCHHMQGIRTRWLISWDGPRDIDVPSSVRKIVFMEMDRPVFFGRSREPVLSTRPVVPGNASGREIDQTPVEMVGRSISDPINGVNSLRRDLRREVPGSQSLSSLRLSNQLEELV